MKSILMTWLSLMALLAMPVFGQVATGTPPMGSFGGGPFDIINLGNLNSHFAIPVRHKAGRQVPFVYDISYDSSIWTPTNVSGVIKWMPSSFGSYWGWQGLSSTSGSGSLTYSTTTNSGSCGQFGTNHWNSTQYSNFVYSDESGAHSFGGYFTVWISTDGPPGTCPPAGSQPATVSGVPAIDGSGFTLYALATASSLSQTMTSRTGTSFSGIGGQFNSIDANGNQLSTASGGVFTDTLGQTALTVAGAPPSNTTLSYTAPSGATAQYTVSYVSYTVKTNFGCGIGEYNVPGVYLVDRITLPDNSSYQFKYEETPGDNDQTHVTARIATITLPTGGTIAYSYTGGNNGIVCADGSTAGLTRTLNPGGQWTYTRTGSGNQWTTTVTTPPDPTVGNKTVINFAKDSGTTFDSNFYETQRQVYQDTTTLLLTTINCWNGNFTSCSSHAVFSPISQLDAYKQLPSGTLSLSETKYNFGLVTEDKEFDYGVTLGSAPATSPVNDTITTYTALGKPSSVVAKDGSGTIFSNASYGYDESAVQATSGTPQHVSVSGPRGNLTTITRTVAGSNVLTQHFSYYDTGNIYQATDVNNAVTGYSYGNCGNSFLTQVSMPLGLSTSMTWNCAGGVQTGATDLNGRSTSINYTDAHYWRPANSIDQASSQTNFSYKNPLKTEVYMSFNGNTSITDQLTMNDGLGRLVTTQRRQSPTSNNYDTVENTYDALGRVSTVTMPYQGAAYQLTSTAPVTKTTYDALNRPLVITDGGQGTVSYSYTNNDVLQAIGPAPTNENTKRKQMEYDALGRLTSVCEITLGTTAYPAGTCGQTNQQTGYWTKYTYDALGNLKQVTQNAQSASSQIRTYAYDMLSRLTSETNPEENNTATAYTYDSASACASSFNSGSYPGDLIEKVDAAGNATCYAYDSLHRNTYTNNPSGPNASTTPMKVYYYDAGHFNVTSNAKGQLASAGTCSNPACAGSWITGEDFGYSATGDLTDVYQFTPSSGGTYHSTASYYPNGALHTLVAPVGSPTMTFAVDGEGRTSTVSGSSGQNPVTATSYNTAGQVTGVTFGSGDGDTYQFDTNTGRMKQYQFKMGSLTDTGILGWNANGSLGSLAITDQINPANTQTCTYAHDDMSRIASSHCGSTWSQDFTYDPFGNLTKAGSIAWNPLYDTAKNRYTLGGTSYDANGDLLTDTFHTFGYDADGNVISFDGTSIVYDALNRMVERGGIALLMGPVSSKPLATMAGQTVNERFLPLPGGAMMRSSYGYRHGDWLGSARLLTSFTGSLQTDVAYAPFGENYAAAGPVLDLGFTQGATDSLGQLLGPNEFDFDFRKYNSTQGRWLTPDPAGMAAADPTNPQSWNRYAYVMNYPLAMVDPLGLFTTSPCPIMTIRTGGMCANISEILIPGCYVNLLYEGGFGGIGCGSLYYGPPNTDSSAGGGSSAPINTVDGILRGNNPCSTFFNSMAVDFTGSNEPVSAPDMFQSDNIRFSNNADFTLYAANTSQGTGAGSRINVNINSPWTFSVRSGVNGPPLLYHVGPFLSSTLQGQTVELMHEFAHNINSMNSQVFPPDDGIPTQSFANTNTIVTNCAATIQSVTQ